MADNLKSFLEFLDTCKRRNDEKAMVLAAETM